MKKQSVLCIFLASLFVMSGCGGGTGTDEETKMIQDRARHSPLSRINRASLGYDYGYQILRRTET